MPVEVEIERVGAVSNAIVGGEDARTSGGATGARGIGQA